MKDELGGEIMLEFLVLRPKAYCYLLDNSDENKKQQIQKRRLN